MKFFLFLIVFYFVFRFLSRIFYVFLLNKIKKHQAGPYDKKRSKRYKEGEVSIDKMPKNKSSDKNNLGDYVDYEEID